MSSKEKPEEKIIVTRKRAKQRLISFDENRSNLANTNENPQNRTQPRNSTHIRDQFVQNPIQTNPINLDQTQASTSQFIPANVPIVNPMNTCQDLVPFIPQPIPFPANFDSNQIIQHIYIPDEILQNLNVPIFNNPIIALPPNFAFNQTTITYFGQEFLFTNIPFIKSQPEPNFAFVSRDRRPIFEIPPTKSLEQPKMALFSVKDLVSAIPTYNGDEKQLETFINVCSKFYSLIKDDQKDRFVTIVQTKITGEALADLQPIDDLKTWDNIKKKLEEKLKTPDTYEFAQEELSTIRQRKSESMEEYGKRIRKGLEKLNLATKSLTQDDAALVPLRKANEVHAIRKFEQNMFDEKIKLMIGAANFQSLREAIKFAMNKELFRKTATVKTCTFCKNIGHTEDECRKKSIQTNGKKEQKDTVSAQGGNSNNFRRNYNSYPSRWYVNRNEGGQKYYSYANKGYDGNNSNYKNQGFSNQQGSSQRTNSSDQNYTNSRPNSHESNQQENNKTQNNNNNGQPKQSGSFTQSTGRFDRNTPKNMRTIHEINSQLEAIAIAEEQSQASANTSKN